MIRAQNLRAHWIKPISWVVIVSIIAIVTYSIVTKLAEMNKGFEVHLDKEGKVVISVGADASFDEVLMKAINQDSGRVDAILAGKQYYKPTNPQLVGALGKLKASQPGSQEIFQGLLKLLWNLEGPFQRPGTLSGANERMMEAFDDLEAALQEAKAPGKAGEASVLLTELWRDSLERKGVFKPRLFQATIEIIPYAPTGDTKPETVFACPGSMLVDRTVFISAVGSMMFEVSQNATLFNCGHTALTDRQILAERSVRLGLGESAFWKLINPGGEAGIEGGKSLATFEIYPKGLAAPIL